MRRVRLALLAFSLAGCSLAPSRVTPSPTPVPSRPTATPTSAPAPPAQPRLPANPGWSEVVQPLPANAGFVVAWDLRGQVTVSEVLRNAKSELKGWEAGRKGLADRETDLGFKLEEVAPLLEPAGYYALVPADEFGLFGPPEEKTTPDPPTVSFQGCSNNLKALGNACERYATEHQGHYPGALSGLVPGCLDKIPICPDAGSDTYSATYTSAASPDTYTMFCQGHHHPALPADFPRYTAYEGLANGRAQPSESKPRRARVDPDTCWGWKVKDARGVAARLGAVLGTDQQDSETLEGDRFWIVGSGRIGVHEGYLMYASHKKAIRAQRPDQRLASDARFRQTLQALAPPKGLLWYFPTHCLVDCPGQLVSTWDEKTRSQLKEFRALSGWLALRGSSLQGAAMLELEPGPQEALAQALLRPTQPARPTLASSIPRDWDFLVTGDLAYLTGVTDAWRALARPSKPSSDPVSGQIALSGDFLRKLPLSPYGLSLTNPTLVALCDVQDRSAALKSAETLAERWMLGEIHHAEVASLLAVATGKEGEARLQEVKNVGDGMDTVPEFRALNRNQAATLTVDLSKSIQHHLGDLDKAGGNLAWLGKKLAAVDGLRLASGCSVEKDRVAFDLQCSPGLTRLLWLLPLTGVGAEPLNGEQERYRACCQHVRDLASQVEYYSTDHEGRYPRRLEELHPHYAWRIPHCPEAHADSYSKGYAVDASFSRFTLTCTGPHGQKHPLWDSKVGSSF